MHCLRIVRLYSGKVHSTYYNYFTTTLSVFSTPFNTTETKYTPGVSLAFRIVVDSDMLCETSFCPSILYIAAASALPCFSLHMRTMYLSALAKTLMFGVLTVRFNSVVMDEFLNDIKNLETVVVASDVKLYALSFVNSCSVFSRLSCMKTPKPLSKLLN